MLNKKLTSVCAMLLQGKPVDMHYIWIKKNINTKRLTIDTIDTSEASIIFTLQESFVLEELKKHISSEDANLLAQYMTHTHPRTEWKLDDMRFEKIYIIDSQVYLVAVNSTQLIRVHDIELLC